ncbi:effector-associated constant component EACC1 [Streptomyces antnestii]|uniref:effector-associated constant component EACC1 n=1 Tax=Streptomyces antnestii TaxID=2494256 RepID=UPI001CB9B13A
MEFTVIAAEESAEASLLALAAWLRSDDSLHAAVAMTYADPQAGQMGRPIRGCRVSVGTRAEAAACFVSLAAWLRTHQVPRGLTLSLLGQNLDLAAVMDTNSRQRILHLVTAGRPEGPDVPDRGATGGAGSSDEQRPVPESIPPRDPVKFRRPRHDPGADGHAPPGPPVIDPDDDWPREEQ